MVIGEENRNRELHGQHRHATSALHSHAPLIHRLHHSNSMRIIIS